MNKHVILAGALALCLTLSACGDKAPKQEEVEAAIRDGSLTVEDTLDKGWIDQAWVDSYMEENSVPAAAADSPRAGSGTAPAVRSRPRSTWCATATRATPARSWTAPSWRAIPTACWRA